MLVRLLVGGLFFPWLLTCAPPPPALPGNSGGSEMALYTECNLPSDQTQTLSGHWLSVPIPVAFSSSPGYQFDLQTEVPAILSALDQWNTFFEKSRQIPKIFDYGSHNNLRTTSDPPPTPGSCPHTKIQSNGDFLPQASIGFYKKSTQWGFGNQVIAITNFCTKPSLNASDPFRQIFTAALQVNNVNFFTSQTPQPDLESIVLHELGHLLGLDHSCQTSTASCSTGSTCSSSQSGFPICSDPQVNSDYLEASLFPIFRFNSQGQGEVRNLLKKNDQERSNCLYDN